MSLINIKDFNNKKRFNNLEISKFINKLLQINYLNNLNNKTVNKKTISFLDKHLQKKNQYSKTKFIRYCILTGRSRGSIRKLGGVSRVLLRDMLQLGIIPGYKKAVW